jgi:hypothetical protein
MAHRERAHRRYDVHLSAELRTPFGLETAMTRNVSVGGAAIDLPHDVLKEGQKLTLSLFLVVEGVEDASKPPLAVGAEVQWVGEGDSGNYTAGLKFTDITTEQKAWLEKFLALTEAT